MILIKGSSIRVILQSPFSKIQTKMTLSSQNLHKKFSYSLAISLLVSLSFLLRPSLCDPRATEAGLVCSNNKAPSTQRGSFVSSFQAALDSLTSQVTRSGYGTTTNGTGNITVYAFGQCMGDVTGSDCNLCFAQIKTKIDKCLPYVRLTPGGRVFFDGCFLRYDDHDFQREVLSEEDKTVCGSEKFSGNKTVFKRNVVDLVKNLSAQGAKNGGFSFGSSSLDNMTVYALVQCWEYVNSSGCGTCLANAATRVNLCPPKNEGRVLNSGCYLRYSTDKFYNNSGAPPPVQSHGANHSAVVLATLISALAFVMLLAAGVVLGKEKFVKKQKEKKQLGTLMTIVKNSKFGYSYEMLEKATNYFHHTNQLGQGGSASVYKGILPDGRVVAVKRLYFNTRQWVDHFFNEIDLISSVQHKNLVKLLGCSIAGPESLLVYEFVPNRSLHSHLFGKDTKPLNWEQRWNIILGTAEGLAYLHEESKLRIIHRDIKLNNILLDNDMTPKIADFGLARLLPEDKTHLSTAIAGTLGYMAPEYIVCGKLTEKADVYGFGVVLIELVAGKKNASSSSQDSVSMCMLHMIWSLHVKGRLHEAVDKALEGQFPEEEASRVLKIGLLCVQANAEARPFMSTVVKMLRDKDYELAEPTQPPFLDSTNAEITRQFQQTSSRHSAASTRPSAPESRGSESESLLNVQHA